MAVAIDGIERAAQVPVVHAGHRVAERAAAAAPIVSRRAVCEQNDPAAARDALATDRVPEAMGLVLEEKAIDPVAERDGWVIRARNLFPSRMGTDTPYRSS